MPKLAKELNALSVSRFKHPGGHVPVTISVGGVAGLMLQTTPNNAKSWVIRTMVGSRRREIGLGAFPELSLAAARDAARSIRSLIRNGVDPVESRKSQRVAILTAQKRGLTFSLAVDRYLEAKLSEFQNDKHKKQWRSTLDQYARPVLGDMLVENITVHDLLQVLEPIWITKAETASRLRGRLESILAWATVKGHRTGDNPARWSGNLKETLPRPRRVQRIQHHPAMPLDQASSWFSALRTRPGVSARALEFLALTAARSGEVRGATWDEIDFKNGIWTIAAHRMKMKREHRVPLSHFALEILSALPRVSAYIFPSPRGKSLSDTSLLAVMKRMQLDASTEGQSIWKDKSSNRPAVPHGMRSTFRDWAGEMSNYPRDMAELALAHSIGDQVELAYRRGDMIEKRRLMMNDWAIFLTNV